MIGIVPFHGVKKVGFSLNCKRINIRPANQGQDLKYQMKQIENQQNPC